MIRVHPGVPCTEAQVATTKVTSPTKTLSLISVSTRQDVILNPLTNLTNGRHDHWYRKIHDMDQDLIPYHNLIARLIRKSDLQSAPRHHCDAVPNSQIVCERRWEEQFHMRVRGPLFDTV